MITTVRLAVATAVLAAAIPGMGAPPVLAATGPPVAAPVLAGTGAPVLAATGAATPSPSTAALVAADRGAKPVRSAAIRAAAAAPTDVSAEAGDGSISVNWIPVDGTGPVTYEVWA